MLKYFILFISNSDLINDVAILIFSKCSTTDNDQCQFKKEIT